MPGNSGSKGDPKVPKNIRSPYQESPLPASLVEVKLRSDRGEQMKPVVRVISIKYANQQT